MARYNDDIHDRARKTKRLLERIESNRAILKSNRVAILAFARDCYSDGLTHGRVEKLAYLLTWISTPLGKPFRKATKQDLKRLLLWLSEQPYSEFTKYDVKVAIKKFWKWLSGTDECPPVAKWIKTGGKIQNQKLPQELLSPDEIVRIISAARHPRDKALIAVLYESGCRIGELLTMRIRSIQPSKSVTFISVFGKTGARRIPLVSSTPHLSTWLNHHPARDDPQAYVWIGTMARITDKPIGYTATCKLLQGLARDARISKRIYPHLFRHSRATHLAKDLTEAQMKIFFGWTTDSSMPATYVHLSGRDVEQAILKIHGLATDHSRDDADNLTPKSCNRCGSINAHDSRHCSNCACLLDVSGAIDESELNRAHGEVLNGLLSDSAVQSRITTLAQDNEAFRRKLKSLLRAARHSSP